MKGADKRGVDVTVINVITTLAPVDKKTTTAMMDMVFDNLQVAS